MAKKKFIEKRISNKDMLAIFSSRYQELKDLYGQELNINSPYGRIRWETMNLNKKLMIMMKS